MKHFIALTTCVATCALLLCAGCQRRAQGSSALREEGELPDSAALEQIYAFQLEVLNSEDEVLATVKSDTVGWVQHDCGWWYRYTHRSEKHVDYYAMAPPKDLSGLIRESVYSLDGKTLLVDAIREFDNIESSPSADGEEPYAYRIMLREMFPKDTVVMLLPWSMAYGAKGRDYVAPYTNIRVLLTMHTSPYIDVETENDTIINNEL